MADGDAALVAGAISLCGVVVSALVALYVSKRTSDAARGTELLRLEHDRYMSLVDDVFALDRHILLTEAIEFPNAGDLEAGRKLLDKIGQDVVLIIHDKPAAEAALRFDQAARALVAAWNEGLLPNGGISARQLGAATRFRDASAAFVVGIRKAMRAT